MNDILRRKVRRGAATGGDGGPGADHGWRLALARAMRDSVGLLIDIEGLRLQRRGLAELLELPPDRALIALLDGPGGGLGMIALSPEVTGALVEMQTIGRIAGGAQAQRRPTRTDAAMVTGILDRALAELEGILAEEADLVWAGGFRYASFLEDARPLGLLLEDQPYRVLTADLSMAEGARKGQVILALPAEGRGIRPPPRKADAVRGVAGPVAAPFSSALGEVVMGADCVLNAVIARATLPLRVVMGLQPDQIIPLTGAALDAIAIEGIDGRTLGTARLGQHRGMRALRLSEVGAGGGSASDLQGGELAGAMSGAGLPAMGGADGLGGGQPDFGQPDFGQPDFASDFGTDFGGFDAEGGGMLAAG